MNIDSMQVVPLYTIAFSPSDVELLSKLPYVALPKMCYEVKEFSDFNNKLKEAATTNADYKDMSAQANYIFAQMMLYVRTRT